MVDTGGRQKHSQFEISWRQPPKGGRITAKITGKASGLNRE
jgi:hypothetical protein